MYVGDDAAVESATAIPLPVKLVVAGIAMWLLFGRR